MSKVIDSPFHQQIIERCLSEIKQALKTRNISYQDLAKSLDVSLNTVKRMLNQTDIPLQRLLTLCDICGLELSELFARAEQHKTAHHYFTDRQDQAFAKAPHLLRYFYELFYQNKSPAEIEQEFQLSSVSTYRYLRALENIELIELLPNNRVKFKVKPPLGFAANSRVLKNNIAQYIQQTCKQVLSDKEDSRFTMMVKPMRLPEGAFLQMVSELRSIIDKYSEASELVFVQREDLPQFQITFVGHPLDASEFTQADIINWEGD